MEDLRIDFRMQMRPTRFAATRMLECVSGFVPLANNVIRFDPVVEPFSTTVIRSGMYPESLSVRYMKDPSRLSDSGISTGGHPSNDGPE